MADFPGGSEGNESSCNAEDPGLIPGLGISLGEGNGYPLQYSCLENSRTNEPGGLQSKGLQRVRHEKSTLTLHYMAKGKIFTLSSCFRVFVIKSIELFQHFFPESNLLWCFASFQYFAVLS